MKGVNSWLAHLLKVCFELYILSRCYQRRCVLTDTGIRATHRRPGRYSQIIPQHAMGIWARFLSHILKPKSLETLPPSPLAVFYLHSQVTWRPSHLAKSQVTSVADLEISWVALTSHYHHCANLSEGIELIKYLSDIFLSSVWVRLSIFSPLSIIQYVGLYVFSLLISVVMIERIYILCLIIIIKSEVWTISHCLGLGHETMVSAVCLSIILSLFVFCIFLNFHMWHHKVCFIIYLQKAVRGPSH